jgi:hypothetical protein
MYISFLLGMYVYIVRKGLVKKDKTGQRPQQSHSHFISETEWRLAVSRDKSARVR